MWDELEGELVKDLAAAIREKNGMVMIHNCGERIYFDAQIKRMQRKQFPSFIRRMIVRILKSVKKSMEMSQP